MNTVSIMIGIFCVVITLVASIFAIAFFKDDK
jgi:hypothetical protein